MPNPPAHTLSNLIPYKAGYDPRRNNKGRPAVGLTLEEAYSVLEDREKYPIAKLEEVRTSHKSGAMRASADLWLRIHANGDEFAKNGQPLVMHDLQHLHDRTVGKPTQRMTVETHETKDPAALKIELLRLLADQPQLRASLGLDVAGLLGSGEAGNEGTPPQTSC